MFHITILNYSNKYLLSGSRIAQYPFFKEQWLFRKDTGKIIDTVLDGIEQDA